MLLRKVASYCERGLFHPRPLKAAEIGATSRLSSGRIVRCFIQAV